MTRVGRWRVGSGGRRGRGRGRHATLLGSAQGAKRAGRHSHFMFIVRYAPGGFLDRTEMGELFRGVAMDETTSFLVRLERSDSIGEEGGGGGSV